MVPRYPLRISACGLVMIIDHASYLLRSHVTIMVYLLNQPHWLFPFSTDSSATKYLFLILTILIAPYTTRIFGYTFGVSFRWPIWYQNTQMEPFSDQSFFWNLQVCRRHTRPTIYKSIWNLAKIYITHLTHLHWQSLASNFHLWSPL